VVTKEVAVLNKMVATTARCLYAKPFRHTPFSKALGGGQRGDGAEGRGGGGVGEGQGEGPKEEGEEGPDRRRHRGEGEGHPTGRRGGGAFDPAANGETFGGR